MAEVLATLFVFLASGLAWLAWNHPNAYDKISPYLVAAAFVLAALIYGLQIGYEGAVEKLRPFLTPAGLIEAEKVMLRVSDKTTLYGVLAIACAFGLLLLGGLRLLPRGTD